MGWVFHNRKDKQGKQAIIYQVYYGGDMFSVSTGVKCKKGSFNKGSIRGDAKSTFKLDAIKKIILEGVEQGKSEIPEWSKEELKTHIKYRIAGADQVNGKVRVFLYDYWQQQIDSYIKRKKFDSATHNENSRKSIFKHIPQEIYLDQVTRKHLQEIKEAFPDKSPSTINGYLRDLRAVIKRAIDVDELIHKNPFAGFTIPGMKQKINVALTLDELQAFEKIKPVTDYQKLVKDSCMFMYYCFGMRVHDMVLLNVDNIKGDTLHYTASKNKREFRFKMLPEAVKIVNRWKGDHFIFPYLDKKITNQELQHKMSLIRRSMHQTLNYMAAKAGITKTLGPHVFRHTWNFIQSPHLTIQERQRGLGHASALTTEMYDKTMPDLDNLVNQTKR